MKKTLFLGGLVALISLFPTALSAQSTEGTDFWVTLMRGDEQKFDKLLLKFSAQKATKVYIENTYTGYQDTVEVGDDAIEELLLNDNSASCYVTDAEEEKPANKALHVTSDKPISLIAANYKDKSFDVASILPTSALLNEYRIQCYSPSAHADNSQGSQFAIVAADDNVVVDITPSANTKAGKTAGQTFTTDTLKRGQVYYVWTGNGSGLNYDFTGTVVKSRDSKKIAVFNGNSHTNIPSKVRDRDHIFSQAMPINYWGKRFAITSSLTTIDGKSGYWERIDKIRVQALIDGTVVKIDGVPVHTFDFVNGSAEDKKHFFEFDFGAKDEMNGAEYKDPKDSSKDQAAYSGDGHEYMEGASHFIETSCPSAVHLFMTSNRYDHEKVKNSNDKYCNGDPSEIWVNPIEQKIKKLTFCTFETEQVKDHFLNIVTTKDNVNSVKLDGDDISNKFSELTGNSEYVFARISGVIDGTHTLTADSGFIAHVYGFGEKESYGYPAGGNTKDLSASVLINGKEFKPGQDNLICGAESVEYSAELNYEIDSIYWFFGDGLDTMLQKPVPVLHPYANPGKYDAYVLIYRQIGEANECFSWSENIYDSIHFYVNIGNYKIELKSTEIPSCILKGDESDIKIYLDNPGRVPLTGDSVSVTFDEVTKAAGFKEDDMKIVGDSLLIIHVPGTATDNTDYTIHIRIGSECEESVFEKDIEFQMIYDANFLAQRYDYALGVAKASFPDQELSNFVWFHNGDTIQGQHNAVLLLDRNNPDNKGEFKVCFDIARQGKDPYRFCTCPIEFDAAESAKKENFDDDQSLKISAVYSVAGGKVFVNADYEGQVDLECYAQWINASGQVYQDLKFDIPDGGCTIPTPAEKGLYLLRVQTGKGCRSFKFVINQ